MEIDMELGEVARRIGLLTVTALGACATAQSASPAFEDLIGHWAVEEFRTPTATFLPPRSERDAHFVRFRDDLVIEGVAFGPEVIFGMGCNSDSRTVRLDGDTLRLRPPPEIDNFDIVIAGVGCPAARERRRDAVQALFDSEPEVERLSGKYLTVTGRGY